MTNYLGALNSAEGRMWPCRQSTRTSQSSTPRQDGHSHQFGPSKAYLLLQHKRGRKLSTACKQYRQILDWAAAKLELEQNDRDECSAPCRYWERIWIQSHFSLTRHLDILCDLRFVKSQQDLDIQKPTALPLPPQV